MAEVKGKASARLEWLRKRTTGIGSSDSPVLMLGEVYGRTPLDTYLSKVTEPKDDGGDNPNFRRGNTYEPLALALYEQRSGVRVHAPQTEAERFLGFHVRDPELHHVYGDYDGFAADGWVLEVKSPMQRVCDRIRSEGLKDYYQIQAAQLVALATRVAAAGMELPGIGVMGPGWTCPGARVIVYEPERCDIMVVELPADPAMGAAIYAEVDRFWREHIVPRRPPLVRPPWEQPAAKPKAKVKAKGGEYAEVEGSAWAEAVAAFIVAREAERVAKARVARAKGTIEAALRAGGKPKVRTADGWKFALSEVAGRKGFDRKLLEAEHPELDLRRYETQGKPYASLRAYGPNDAAGAGEGDDSMDAQLTTLYDELLAFAQGDHAGLELEEVAQSFDDIRSRAELYARMLTAEAGQVEGALVEAGKKFKRDVAAGTRSAS
jgi:hypothetical protein